MKLRLALLLCISVFAASCGGSGSSTQPATEQGAQDAVRAGLVATFDADVDGVLNFMTAACLATVSRDDVRDGLLLVKLFLGDSGLEVTPENIGTSIKTFDGSKATVSTQYLGEVLDDDSGFEFGTDDVKVIYEEDHWVATDCDFGDSTEVDAAFTADALAERGLVGTREEPVPADTGIPLNGDYSISFDDINFDGKAFIEAQDGYASDHEPDEQLVIASVTISYNGLDEPAQANNVTVTAVGPSGIGIDSWGCGSFASELSNQSSEMFSGGAVLGDLCFVVPTDQIDDLVFGATVGFGDSSVFFDPTIAPETPFPIGAWQGPADGASFTAARLAPAPVGEVVDLGDGWTIQVLGSTLDATKIVAQASEWNDPAPEGRTYALVDIAVTYNGTEEPASMFSLQTYLVGDSNLAVNENCSVSDVPDKIDTFADVFPGASISGQACFLIHSTDIDSLVLYARADFFDDEPHVLALN